MKGFVLTYHSHHVVGNDYARNDHVALPADLELITDAGCKIVSLDALADAFFNVAAADSGGDEGELVAITFDDGPIYDVDTAFTTEPGPISGSENPWCLPRYVCGHDWKHPAELSAILNSAALGTCGR
jgi:hypothetical protein